MKVKLEDVANAAGVSVPTVSKTLRNRGGVSPKIQLRVMEAVRETGYQRKSHYLETRIDLKKINLLSFVQFSGNDLFYGDIFKGIHDECTRIGLEQDTTLISYGEELDRDYLIKSLEGVDALLLVGIDDPEILDLLVELEIPATIVNGYDRQMRIPSVTPDYRYGGWQATQHIIDHGHREIMHITHRHRDSMRRRYDGFRDALSDAGIEFDADKHLLDTGKRGGDLGVEAAMGKLLAKGRPSCTAFFCVTDVAAVATIQALTKAGYCVPEDYSVFGFDDLPICQIMTPHISTMNIDRIGLGRAAVRVLNEQVSDPDQRIRRVEMGVNLVARDSVAQKVTENE